MSEIEDLEKKAYSGDVESMFQLGVAYAFGRGAELNLEKALHWLNKAAQAGHPTAGLVLQDIDQTMNASGCKPRSGGGGRRLSTGDTKTIPLPGGAEMEMIYCAPGSFMMGCPEYEYLWYMQNREYENIHKVILTKGFWLGKYPVTQAQWEIVMGSNPSTINPYVNIGSNNPVVMISCNDCNDFIEKINVEYNLNARFPTEAEWEYACRAESVEAYSGVGNLNDMGWYRDNSDFGIHPVGKKAPNNWGFYDMHGNVWEWCADYLDKYPRRTVTDPIGIGTKYYRVFRGGGYSSDADECRSASRKYDRPDSIHCAVGFRLCCSAEP